MNDRIVGDNTWDGHSPVYIDNVFTKATDREIPFRLDVLRLPPESCILDVGRGTGRPAIESRVFAPGAGIRSICSKLSNSITIPP